LDLREERRKLFARDRFLLRQDDLHRPSRLNENCVRYVPEPSTKLGYFWRAPRWIRARFVCTKNCPVTTFNFGFLETREPDSPALLDSGVNEGDRFYAEEMMLQAEIKCSNEHSPNTRVNHLQFHAAAPRSAWNGREARARPVNSIKPRNICHDKVRWTINRAPGSDRLRHRPAAIDYQIGKLHDR